MNLHLFSYIVFPVSHGSGENGWDLKPRKQLKAGHHRPASETSFEWRLAGGPMVARHCMLAGSLDFGVNLHLFSNLVFASVKAVTRLYETKWVDFSENLCLFPYFYSLQEIGLARLRAGLDFGVNYHSCIKPNSHSCLKPLSNEWKSMFKSRDSHVVWT